MNQIFSALSQRHSHSKYFEFGELREENIYLSKLYTRLYLDPGIYFENQSYPNYFNPPENKISDKSDVYSAGMVFFRLMTLLSVEEIQHLFVQNEINSKRRSFVKTVQEIIKKKKESHTNCQNELSKLTVREILLTPGRIFMIQIC
jgi:hypothetical protein